ncbi:hypothetical protein ACO9S2_14190 [Nitrospira sp. NS4]
MSGAAEGSHSVAGTPSICINTQAHNTTMAHKATSGGEANRIGERAGILK